VWVVSQGHCHGVTETPISVTETLGGVTETPKVVITKRDIYLPGFERFWQAYPKRVGKAEAARAWVDLKLEPMADVVVDAVGRHRSAGRFSDDARYILHPVRWLKYRRFEDEVQSAEASANKRDGRYLAG
jgi:hypothetical protein